MRVGVDRWSALLAVVLLASTLVVRAEAQAPAASNDEEARVHFRLGTAYYDSGRFAQAAQEFKQAYDLSKRPQLLYNLFLAYRDAGAIPEAAAALRQYLADTPDVEDRGKLEARLAALEKILESQPPAAAPAQGPVANPEAPPEPAAQPASPNPDEASEPELGWLPWTLIGAGGALVVGGVVSGVLAVKDESKLEADCASPESCTLSDAEVENLKSSGSLKAGLGDALWITGAVAAGVGVAFLFWKPWEKAHEPPRAHVDAACTRSVCGASLTARF